MKFPIEVRGVAFDLDGTLADTLPDLYASARCMLHDLGLPEVDRETVRNYIGQGIDRLVKRLLSGTSDVDPEPAVFGNAAGLFREHYRRLLTNESALFPGTDETLRVLHARGFKLACVTNKSEAFTRPLLESLGVHDLFEEVICGDSLERRKPDPLPLVHCARQFGVIPAQILMVGDSETDTLCARAAGCPVVCVPYGYRSGMELHELDCDAIVPAVSDLLDLILLPGDDCRKT